MTTGENEVVQSILTERQFIKHERLHQNEEHEPGISYVVAM